VSHSVQTASDEPAAAAGSHPLRVVSETGALEQVIVHTPGDEVALVSPENKDELLFDDLIFPDVAREEHQTMVALFAKIVGGNGGVLQFADLLRETFQEEAARHAYVDELIRVLPARNFSAYEPELKALDPEALHRFALTGESPLPVQAHPLPNLLFTRDLSAVVGEFVILSHAARAARIPESVLTRIIFRHHPRFAIAGDKLITLPDDVSFEGGDLLVVSDTMVLIGHSERTSFGGVMAVTQALLERTPIQHVLMVNLPKQRSCMHLDTVFTFADESTCVVFPPLIEAPHDNVFHFEAGDGPGRFRTRMLPSVRVALEEMTGRELTFIPCGGSDPVQQRREQWTDGANLFALAPGLVVGYERNRHTFAELRRHGFHVVDAESFLDFYGDGEVEDDARIAVRLMGHELSRGRGGPRCMTMPLLRVG
jgi:arginine deiminase